MSLPRESNDLKAYGRQLGELLAVGGGSTGGPRKEEKADHF